MDIVITPSSIETTARQRFTEENDIVYRVLAEQESCGILNLPIPILDRSPKRFESENYSIDKVELALEFSPGAC